MTPDDLSVLVTRALFLTLKLCVPVVAFATLAGLLISLLQAATQVQDQTLPFFAKFVVVIVVLMVTGHWIAREMLDFTTAMFDLLPML
ncbi:type III secretion system export apparatus subunit SctS [Pandoraea commovens]|uniref:Type III secretion system protein SpaQ n=1 Tax=Pandoraea commovens TaxID=2508289 RepID=A0A5E4W6N7_9BURK|nr:type III secretion system export apparatus subunit SctS [Pandoraea commovens]VVE20372.1 type III secretion system protein SpaQ [Pandoraea commovens]